MGAAEIQLQKQNFLEAIVAYTRITELDPNNALAFYNLGQAFKGRRREEEAVQAFRKALVLYRQQGDQQGVKRTESMLKSMEN